MKVAIVCDWLTETGGAEEVIKAFHKIFPDAPIYTSAYRRRVNKFYSLDSAQSTALLDVRTGYLNFFPTSFRRFLAPLRQSYFEHLDLSDYDLVISVTGCDAKYVKSSFHLCYCHVPTQYYWGKYEFYLKNPGFSKALNPPAHLFLKLLTPTLRKRDLEAASRPDNYLTASTYSKKQIKKYYKRESEVLFPPVDVKTFSQPVENSIIEAGNCQAKNAHKKEHKNKKNQEESTEQKTCSFTQLVEKYPKVVRFLQNNRGKYYLNYSRQVNWKNLHLAIEACVKLGFPLVLVGDGPEHKKLVKLANELEKKYLKKDLVLFFPALDKTSLRILLKSARAFIFPSVEPFGIAPVEALAAGCPVIALKSGGALDYIKNGKNGLFFAKPTTNSLCYALKRFNKRPLSDKRKIKPSARKFSDEKFEKNFKKILKNLKINKPARRAKKH